MSAIGKTQMTRRHFLELLAAAGLAGAAAGLAGCGSVGIAEDSETRQDVTLDGSAWRHDADNDVYYQIGVPYCEKPAAPAYESMGIYVPGAYFDAQDNGDGTFTCTPSETGSVNGYTAATAPVVMPINTAGYSAQAAPAEYSANGLSAYLQAGFVYVFAGCRGRKMTDDASGAAPWGVTDLKSAVRALRYNDAAIPGDKERIFSFGHSGGGAQSAVLGASGDAPEYDDYLATIGAPAVDAGGKALSDAIFGAMCWCPITNLDVADAAYEWNMGQFADTGTRAEGTFTRLLSRNLAVSYAEHINGLGLESADGAKLTLAEGGEGIYTSGPYYDYVKATVEESLNSFLADTEFPYTPTSSFDADMGAGGGAGRGSREMKGGPAGSPPPDMAGKGPRSSDGGLGEAPEGTPGDGGGSPEEPDGIQAARSGGQPAGGEAPQTEGDSAGDGAGPATYATPADYIAALNGEDAWIEYDEEAGTAAITGLAGFVAACKSPSKDVGAFDALDRTQAENEVFAAGEQGGLHFDAMMAQLLSDNRSAYAALTGWDDSYPSAYAEDRAKDDALGHDSDYRQNAYNPMYYLCEAYTGAGSSQPAPHWRIRTGIEQGDTSSTTEINLALALGSNQKVEDVDFATVWGQGHTMAERTGSGSENFIAWVNGLCR